VVYLELGAFAAALLWACSRSTGLALASLTEAAQKVGDSVLDEAAAQPDGGILAELG